MAMIPEFPTFKKLEITDKKVIEDFTKQYPPYSDYNFTSLWSWDTKGEACFSFLNKNLVIKFNDYITGEPFYSFLGGHDVNSTIESLIAFVISEGRLPSLMLIPEDSIKGVKINPFTVSEDPGNFDYIYDLEKLREYKGSSYEQQRNMKNRFTRKYKNIEVVALDLTKVSDREIVQELNQQWEKNKGYRLDNEEDAMARLLFPTNSFQLISIGVLVDKSPVAFSINEVLTSRYAISHFVKANINFSGVYSYLMQATADALISRGCALLNYEQDLGVSGLRYSKTAFRPVCFLRKYVISSISTD
ncbi:MAG TPA: hypothetical protein DDW41_06325 [Candidatus Andersenbacteria bacterium]|nr:MAG: hypothetical protein UW94_C0007G0029 [Parcubacteria group bacterium GW2011_GWA2_45_14]HBE90795.1 hypothetical protein [Candidatus Andersenbacteria bacterium]